MKTQNRWRLIAVVAMGAAALTPLVAAQGATTATLVVDDNLACAGAAYSSISSAVAAASPGDTIQVCAGIYPETVNVDKPLIFLGAKAGQDGRTGRQHPGQESIVSSPTGDFIIGAGVSGVTIDGFTLQGALSQTGTSDAIEAFHGGSGFTFIDNVIKNNQQGITMSNPDPAQPTEITQNAFINNSVGSSATGGTGIFICCGPANSTTIENNSFTRHREAAVNFAGDSSNYSRGLVVADNRSKNDSTFVVATDSANAVIDGNVITHQPSGNGSAILDYGSNTALRISDNTIKGGYADGTTGIRIANYSGTASTGTTVVDNTINNRFNGIRVSGGYVDLFVASNTVTGSSNVGILVDDTSTGNAFTRNVVATSVVHDCEDDSTGALTAGTGNTWRRDSGNSGNSTPAGICAA